MCYKRVRVRQRDVCVSVQVAHKWSLSRDFARSARMMITLLALPGEQQLDRKRGQKSSNVIEISIFDSDQNCASLSQATKEQQQSAEQQNASWLLIECNW